MDVAIFLAGGLGNRLHTLYSSHYLSMKHKLSFKYFWANQDDCKCTFQDIFNFPSLRLTNDYDDLHYRKKLAADCALTKDIYENQKILWITPFRPIFEDYNEDPDINLAFNDITIQDYIMQDINRINIPENTIGIHVRGGDIKLGLNTDPADARNYVEPEKFFPYIDFYLNLNNAQNFFLSCENIEDENKFTDHYGSSFFIQLDSCVRNRNTPNGIIDGFKNIILLSKCNIIIGMKSSFSSLASKLNNFPQIITLT